MRPARHTSGATVVEMVFAVAIGVVVLGGVIGMLVSVSRLGRAGELAGALQEAALALATIERDALRTVAGPDGRAAIRIGANDLRLAQGEFMPDGRIRASLVRYVPEPQTGGGHRLRRLAGGSSTLLPGLIERFRIEELGGPGGPFLRVTLHVAGRPAPSGTAAHAPGAEPAVVSALVRLAGVEMAGSKFYSMSSFLDDVKAVLGP